MKGGNRRSAEAPFLYLETASVVAVGQKLPALVSQLGNFLRKLTFGGERLFRVCALYTISKTSLSSSESF